MSSEQIKEMLDAMHINTLKQLALNKRINIAHCKSKTELQCAILQNIDKMPENISGIYKSLSTEDRDVVNYLLINKEKHYVSKIYFTVARKNYWNYNNMRTVKALISRLVQTGLVYFDPPSKTLITSRKSGCYEFYIPQEIRDSRQIPIIESQPLPAQAKILKSSQNEILAHVLRNKIRNYSGYAEKNTLSRLEKKNATIAGKIGSIIRADSEGIYDTVKKRYIQNIRDLWRTFNSCIESNLTDKENSMKNLLSILPDDKWFKESELITTIEKYSDNPCKGCRLKERLLECGLIEVAESGGSIVLIKKHQDTSSLDKQSACIMPAASGAYHAKIDSLNENEAFQILCYFDVIDPDPDPDPKKESHGTIHLALSSQKIGYALTRGKTIQSIIDETKCIFKGIEKILESIDKNYGKFLIHTSVSIYEVNDLSLIYRMKPRDNIYCINDKYLVAPSISSEAEEKHIRSLGFVIKSDEIRGDKSKKTE